MSPYLTTLPCSSHGACTYHKHWTSTATQSSVRGHNIIEAAKHPREAWRTRRPSHSQQRTASIQTFPNELLLAICSFLEPRDQACLALTCRRLNTSIGPSVWKYVCEAAGASWYQQAEMLDILQRDLNSEEWWRCSDCERFHPRVRNKHKHDDDHLSKAVAKFHQVRHLRKDDDGNRLRFGPSKEPLYTLDFNLIHAVMDRHLNGASKGSCLNSLRCTGSRSFDFSPGVTVALTYVFKPRIVLDRLLLYSEFKFLEEGGQFSRNAQSKYESVRLFLMKQDFWLCKHMQARNMIRALQAGIVRYMKCSYCPTEIRIRYRPNEAVRICSWQNLGAGRNAEDSRWVHLSRSFGERKEYVWAKEDIKQVYDSIMCSTREEFDRQSEQNKGRGDLYDPDTKEKMYRTLSMKLAERI